jgi:class 3 adenylate cyclase/predicted ATPase
MFCDLVGSTLMAGRMDPEDLRDVITAYQACVATEVTRYSGTVAKYMGDGVLAYFGYPQAHEDDAERAVQAGLHLVAAVPALQPRGEALQVRVGIATGEVVVGDLIGSGAAQEQAVVGETPNLAARLQSLAEPDQVVIAHETRRLVGTLFEVEDLGAVHAKGFVAPIRAWRVMGEGRAESRFEALHGGELTPLIGRQDELNLIRSCWSQACAGEGRVVLLSGEPGLGKSRLVAATQEVLAGDAPVRLRYSCSPHHQDSALFPVIQQLERAADFDHEDDGVARLAKLRALLAPQTCSEDFSLLSELLSLPTEGMALPQGLSPQRKKDRLLEALVRQLEAVARHAPVLMVWEDVHWIDPSSRDLIDFILGRLLQLPILMLVTCRPEFQPDWARQKHVTVLPLKRLSRREGSAMIGQLTRGKALPREIMDQIVERTDGVPLFIEELTSSVLESGLVREEAEHFVLTGVLPPLAIPTTLQGSLMARLDRLAPVREVAQIGAAIGRVFSFALLAAVSGQSEAVLTQALAQLVAAELVFVRGAPPEASYTFKHALVQDAAYATLLKSRRQELHGTIAQLLEERFPEIVRREPEVLARHFEQASLPERAVDYFFKAGQLAIAKSAMAEAITQLNKGLTLIASMPPGPDTDQKELELQIALGSALLPSRGFAAPEVGRTYARARELCREVADDPLQLFKIFNGQMVYYVVRGEPKAVLALGNEALKAAPLDRVWLQFGHRTVGFASFVLGDFQKAQSNLEKALSLQAQGERDTPGAVYVQDAFVEVSSFLSLTMSLLGYLDQGEVWRQEALSRAQTLAHSTSTALTLSYTCLLCHVRRDYSALRMHADELIALAIERGFPHFHASGMVFQGDALARSGQVEVGLEQMRAGVAARSAIGAEHLVSYFLMMLIERSNAIGRPDFKLIAEVLARIDLTHERWAEAELHRLWGQSLILSGQEVCGAETCFQTALAIAHQQRAKLWELRAARSLAQLWMKQGKCAAARDLLAPVYDGFTEGFDKPDLLQAKELLDGLITGSREDV